MFCKKCNVKIEVGGDLCSICKENESIQSQDTEDQSVLPSTKGNRLSSLKISKRHIKMIACIAVGIVLLAGSILLISNVINNADQPLTIEEILDLGEKYLRDLDFEKALEQFLKAIEIDPRNPRGYTGAAEAYIGLGQEQEALKVLQEGLVLLGDDPSIRRMMDDFAVIADIETPLGANIPRDRNAQEESGQVITVTPNQPGQPEDTDTVTEAEPIQNPRRQRPNEPGDTPNTTNNPLNLSDDTTAIPPVTFRVIVRCEFQGILMNESFTPGSRVNISAEEVAYDESYNEFVFIQWLVTNDTPLSLNNISDRVTFFTMPNHNVEILAHYDYHVYFDDPLFAIYLERQFRGNIIDFDVLIFNDHEPGSIVIIDAGYIDGLVFFEWQSPYDDNIIFDDPSSPVTSFIIPMWYDRETFRIYAIFEVSEGEP